MIHRKFPDDPLEYRELAKKVDASFSRFESTDQDEDNDNDDLVDPDSNYIMCLKAAVGFQAGRLPNAFTKAYEYYKKSIDSAKGNVQVTGQSLGHKRIMESYRFWIRCCLDFQDTDAAQRVLYTFLNEIDSSMDLWLLTKIGQELESRGLVGCADKVHNLVLTHLQNMKFELNFDHKLSARKMIVGIKLTKVYGDPFDDNTLNLRLALQLTYLDKNRAAMKCYKIVLTRAKEVRNADVCFLTYLHMGFLHLDHGKSPENAQKMFDLAEKQLESNVSKLAPMGLLSLSIGRAYTSFDLGDVEGAIVMLTPNLQAVKSSKVATPNLALVHLYAACFMVERYRRMSLEKRWNECKTVIDKIDLHVHQVIKLNVVIPNHPIGHPPLTELSLHNMTLQLNLVSATTLVLGCLPGVETNPSIKNQIFHRLSLCFKRMYDEAMVGVYHSSKQRDGVGVKLKRCSECKVSLYCNTKHQRKKRRERFFLHSHKFFCPFLKRWHLVHKAMQKQHSISDTFEKIMTDFIHKMEHELTYVKEEYRPCDKEVRAGTLS